MTKQEKCLALFLFFCVLFCLFIFIFLVNRYSKQEIERETENVLDNWLSCDSQWDICINLFFPSFCLYTHSEGSVKFDLHGWSLRNVLKKVGRQLNNRGKKRNFPMDLSKEVKGKRKRKIINKIPWLLIPYEIRFYNRIMNEMHG